MLNTSKRPRRSESARRRGRVAPSVGDGCGIAARIRLAGEFDCGRELAIVFLVDPTQSLARIRVSACFVQALGIMRGSADKCLQHGILLVWHGDCLAALDAIRAFADAFYNGRFEPP